MSRRAEVCRDFVRGSCRFGTRCKFIHDTSQQPRQQPSSPFGFGPKNQGPQQFNKGGNNYAALSSQKQQPQGSIKEHRCNDPRECKLQIREDLENERPVYWRLTSYAHGKYLPNDVLGDVSFEELRAYAYDSGKQGVPLQSLILNERNMAAAKSKEFEALLKNPYTGPVPSGTKIAPFASAPAVDTTKMTFGTSTPFANVPSANATKMTFGTSTPFASASQTAPKMTFGVATPFASASPSAPKMTFGVATPFANGSPNAPKSSFGTIAPLGSSTFPSGPLQDPSQSRGSPGGGFSFGLGQSQTSKSPFATQTSPAPGFSFGLQPFGSGMPTQISSQQTAVQSNFGFGQNDAQMSNNVNFLPGVSHNSLNGKDSIQTLTVNGMSQSLPPFQNISPPVITEVPMNQVMTNQISPHSDLSAEKSEIWMKSSWKIGEIPEEEPPAFAR